MRIKVTALYLEQKLKKLSELRKSYAETKVKLGEAATHGGATLSKIPEYDSLASDLKVLEAMMNGIQKEISGAELVTPELMPNDIVSIVSRVTVFDALSKAREEYYFAESGVSLSGVKSATQLSPVGKALLGKKVGDTVEFKIPSGKRKLVVESIRKVEGR